MPKKTKSLPNYIIPPTTTLAIGIGVPHTPPLGTVPVKKRAWKERLGSVAKRVVPWPLASFLQLSRLLHPSLITLFAAVKTANHAFRTMKHVVYKVADLHMLEVLGNWHQRLRPATASSEKRPNHLPLSLSASAFYRAALHHQFPLSINRVEREEGLGF
ncbi:hypothetical protein MRB53_002437 [Persea americana]|uniref:Uncharacterized protein n=1 Tax=Persea americana TaxID=3435 RepID=A0ACC2MUP8_PERAE|nr:hypothetical protein MRB53_002437 [Persea americana]